MWIVNRVAAQAEERWFKVAWNYLRPELDCPGSDRTTIYLVLPLLFVGVVGTWSSFNNSARVDLGFPQDSWQDGVFNYTCCANLFSRFSSPYLDSDRPPFALMTTISTFVVYVPCTITFPLFLCLTLFMWFSRCVCISHCGLLHTRTTHNAVHFVPKTVLISLSVSQAICMVRNVEAVLFYIWMRRIEQPKWL